MTGPVVTSTSGRSARLKQALIGLAVVLVVGVILFFMGRMQGRAPIPALEDRAEQAETRLSLAQDRARMMESLALVYRAVLDLDDRNFGTANANLQRAANTLGDVGVGGSTLESIRSEIAAMNLNVAEDLAAQRAQLMRLSTQVTEIMPETVATPEAVPEAVPGDEDPAE